MKVKCSNCKEYIYREEALRFGLVSFCSEECRREASQRKAKRARAKASASPKPSPETRKLVSTLDRGRCRFCGKLYPDHIHHVIYRSEGGGHEVDNLLSLHMKCHGIVHGSKKTFQPLALQVLSMRDSEISYTTIMELQNEANED